MESNIRYYRILSGVDTAPFFAITRAKSDGNVEVCNPVTSEIPTIWTAATVGRRLDKISH